MDEQQAIVMINQKFFLFCCTEQYSISFPDQLLSSDSDYFVRYTHPNGTTMDSSAQLSSASILTSRSPEYDHPCTIHAVLYAGHEHTEDIIEFSLDLVSPVEYLFRKFFANEFEMSDKISDKMTSALLAMSLSYYYVMEGHVEKETRTDEILSTLLNCSQQKTHMNTTRQKKDSSSEESITQFAKHFKLQNTLQYLSGGTSVVNLPVQLPKPLFPPAQDVSMKKPAIIPRTKPNTLPRPPDHKSLYQVPSNRTQSESSVTQPVHNPYTEYVMMDNPRKYTSLTSLNQTDPPNDEEDYCFMEQTDDSKMHYQKPLKASKSDQISNSPLSKTSSTAENVITDEVYVLCDSTPVEVAAAAVVKKRGPPPRLPAPYRESHTLDTARQQSSVKCNSNRLESTSSIESSSQEAQISPTLMKAVKSQEVFRPASDPLPRKKYNLFRNKSKVKQ